MVGAGGGLGTDGGGPCSGRVRLGPGASLREGAGSGESSSSTREETKLPAKVSKWLVLLSPLSVLEMDDLSSSGPTLFSLLSDAGVGEGAESQMVSIAVPP